MTDDNVPVWQADGALAFPALTRDVHADVCVVGLGASGLTCVQALIDAGRSVIGIDAGTVAGGAAGRNGGFLLGGLAIFHHDAVARLGRDAARAIYEETLKEVARMEGETPAAVRRTGSLRIAHDEAEAADCLLQYEAMRADGLPVERYAGPEGAGLLFPVDAAFDPALRCRVLAERVAAGGARLYEQSAALAIGDGVVAAPRGRVLAEQTIVAVDGGLDVVFPELSQRVRSARLQMLATEPAGDVHLPRPVYTRWGLDYWQQRADGRVVLGGCRDVGGDGEWTTDTRPTEAVQGALTQLLRARLATRAAVTHRWAATVAYTESGMPILEEVRPGVWAVGSYSGTGNVVGALCGRAAAELVLTGRSAIAELLRA